MNSWVQDLPDKTYPSPVPILEMCSCAKGLSNLLSNLLSDPVFKIDKTCIDCDVEYEARYHEIGGLNCHVCGLTSHGCKPNKKMQAAELCGMSKGYKWLCYECTK